MIATWTGRGVESGSILTLWNASDNTPMFKKRPKNDWVTNLDFTTNDKYLFSYSSRDVQIWDLDGKCLYEDAIDRSVALGICPDGQRFIILNPRGQSLEMRSIPYGSLVRKAPYNVDANSYANSHASLHLSQDGKLLALSAMFDINIFSTENGQHLYTLRNSFSPFGIKSDHGGSLLRTNGGDFVLGHKNSQKLPSSRLTFRGLGLSDDTWWITWNNKKAVFLPTEYRPSGLAMLKGRFCIHGQDAAIAVGTQVLILRFQYRDHAGPWVPRP
jgi:WD40 repeat protein